MKTKNQKQKKKLGGGGGGREEGGERWVLHIISKMDAVEVD